MCVWRRSGLGDSLILLSLFLKFLLRRITLLILHTCREMKEISVIIEIIPNIQCHMNSVYEFSLCLRIDKKIVRTNSKIVRIDKSISVIV